MKVYISADMEGVTGVNNWDEVTKDKGDYPEFQKQMTAEVAAACSGALKAGATEILIKDAHDSGRNILAAELPRKARLIRGWSGHPLSMVQEVDKSFAAAMMIGYHSRAFSGGNPLAHTWSYSKILSAKLNGNYMSEFMMCTLAAEQAGVPVVMVAGDLGLSQEIKGWNANIITVAVKEGVGDSTINIHPHKSLELIEAAAAKALSQSLDRYHLTLPDHFRIELQFRSHATAYRMSYYPGASRVDDHTVALESDDYFDVLRFVMLAH